MTPRLIGSEIYRGSSYGPKHPLAIPRVSTMLDLVRALGWVAPAHYIDSPQASLDDLARFHARDYLDALVRAERAQAVSAQDRVRFRLGADGNPVFREMFRRPATGAGGTLLAARLTAEGGVVHVPGGGTHHGRPDRASGFCYLNDAVLGLLAWLDQGLRNILYLDLDAHHGDGVQDAFHDDPRVFTLSIHEDGRWPFTGGSEDRAGGHAANIPVPPGFNDTEMAWVLHHAILPVIDRLRPQAIMVQCGADALEEDPLARLSLSNNAHRAVIAAVMPLAPRLIVLGGGGYNPWSVARCWAGVWGVLAGFAMPDRLPPAAEAVLRGLAVHRAADPAVSPRAAWQDFSPRAAWRDFSPRAAWRDPPEHWFTTLADAPRPGVVRAAVRRAAAAALAGLPADPAGVA